MAAAQLLAAADTANVTHLTINACDPQARWTDYFIVKTPVTLLSATITNEAFQKAMEPVFAKRVDTTKAIADTGKRTSEILQTETEIKGNIVPVGKDETCIYFGGVIDVTQPTQAISYTLAVVGCMTVIGGKVVTVYRYGRGTDIEHVKVLMPSARLFANGIKESPAR